MAPSLEYSFTWRGYVDQANTVSIKTIKGGPQRSVLPISFGFLRGNGLDAELVPGGHDVPLVDPETNTAHLDVCLNFRLKNGHALYLRYLGVLQLDELSAGPISFASDAKSTSFGDHEWFSMPIIETSDPELKWVERSAFMGEGRWVVEDGKIGIEHEVYRARPSR